MGDNLEVDEAEPAPPPPGTNKVEITVAGHTIVVESADSLADVAGYAYSLHEATAGSAQRIPIGFDAVGAHLERAEPYVEPSGLEGWEDDHVRRMDWQQRERPALSVTRRLVHPDTPGGDRTRLWPMPLDREQRPLP
jgi:hypothetical protein